MHASHPSEGQREKIGNQVETIVLVISTLAFAFQRCPPPKHNGANANGQERVDPKMRRGFLSGVNFGIEEGITKRKKVACGAFSKAVLFSSKGSSINEIKSCTTL